MSDVISIKETQQSAPASTQKSGILGNLTSFIPMILIFAVFYFFLIRPQDKKRKAQEALINTVKKGEEIVTHSGMFGVVVKVDKDILEVQISKGVVIRILKQAVANITSRKKELSEKHIDKEQSTQKQIVDSQNSSQS